MTPYTYHLLTLADGSQLETEQEPPYEGEIVGHSPLGEIQGEVTAQASAVVSHRLIGAEAQPA